MYALFPNEARTYPEQAPRIRESRFPAWSRSPAHTKEDDYVDINQIRELVRVAEESGVGEIVVEEERHAHRRPHAGRYAAPAAAGAAAPAAAGRSRGSRCRRAAPAAAAAGRASVRPTWYAGDGSHGGHVTTLPRPRASRRS